MDLRPPPVGKSEPASARVGGAFGGCRPERMAVRLAFIVRGMDRGVLASSRSLVMVFETGLPTRYYLSRTDVDFGT
jgi:hypothetical protein